MWLIISLTSGAVIALYHNRDYCNKALSILETRYPDYFYSARLVAHYVHPHLFSRYLSPIISDCLDEHDMLYSD